jgi:hypothetical protein
LEFIRVFLKSLNQITTLKKDESSFVFRYGGGAGGGESYSVDPGKHNHSRFGPQIEDS